VWGALSAELRPLGKLETYLAARIVSGIWRMNRAARIEASLFNDSPIRAKEKGSGRESTRAFSPHDLLCSYIRASTLRLQLLYFRCLSRFAYFGSS
jgi:hypothetical protein